MSDTPNDGGAAFAVPPVRLNMLNEDPHWSYPYTGMTLRDYFAAAALQGVLMNYTTQKFGLTEQSVAEYAYFCADAMLKQRTETKEAKP